MIKKILKWSAVVVAAAFVIAQFFGPRLTNPPTVEADTLGAVVNVPENVNSIIQTSCADCHTNTTVFPWYARVAPVSWWLADHIDEGRSKLNFSVWRTYPPKKQAHKLEELCEEVDSRQMPLPSYLWVHWDAKLSDEQIRTLCDWSKAERTRLGQSGGDGSAEEHGEEH